MVLESLTDPFRAERRPWETFFLGFAYATIALFLALWIFKDHASLVMVFLTVMAAIPFVFAAIKHEEEKDLIIEQESVLLKEHGKALSYLVFLFLGMSCAYAFWYTILPINLTLNLFNVQIQTIDAINNRVSGAYIMNFDIFTQIFFNNVKVLSFCILFAFLYGVGAIFILTWNASVVGTAMGNFIRNNLTIYANSVGFVKVANYFQVVALGMVRYMIHGIPEMAAYFVGGLAGGIISIAVIRHDYRTQKFERIVFDSSELITLAILILLVAALIEVYITPIFFI